MKSFLRVAIVVLLGLFAIFAAALGFLMTVEGVVTIPDNAPAVEAAFLKLLLWVTSANPKWSLFFLALILVVCVGTLLWHPEKGWLYWFKNAEPGPLAARTPDKVNTASDALEIEFRESEPFISMQQSAGFARRSLFIHFYNRGNGFLTDTRVYIKNTVPVGPSNMLTLTASLEPIPLDHFRPVRLADYVEVPLKGDPALNEVTLGWMHGGGFLGGPLPSFGVPLVSDPLIVTVQASAAQCRDCFATFKVWVEENPRKLRAQRH